MVENNGLILCPISFHSYYLYNSHVTKTVYAKLIVFMFKVRLIDNITDHMLVVNKLMYDNT